MWTLSRDKSKESLDEVLGKLNIVPLTISYEIDPCDVMKAREMAYGAGYEKAPFEDLESIAQGIQGQKGHVHIQFGTPMNQVSLSVADAVSRIDDAMVANYRLFKTNFWACEALGHVIDQSDRDVAEASITQSAFLARFDELSKVERQQALEMYARPALNVMASKGRV